MLLALAPKLFELFAATDAAELVAAPEVLVAAAADATLELPVPSSVVVVVVGGCDDIDDIDDDDDDDDEDVVVVAVVVGWPADVLVACC